ncbi:MAG: hypothetical protein ACREP8_10905 [Candidatus Binatia bacterium]
MGTYSIVILWYGLLALILLLLSHQRSPTIVWAAGAVAALFLLFSFFSHRRHGKRKLFLMIVLPLLFLGIGTFVIEDSGVYPAMPSPPPLQWVPPSQLEVTDLRLKHSFFVDTVTGKIRNNSNNAIDHLVLRLRIMPPRGDSEVHDLIFRDLNLAPGAVREFSQTLLGFHARKAGDWQWDLRVVAASGEAGVGEAGP